MKKSVSLKGMINFNLLSEPSLSVRVLRNVVSQAARIKFTLNRVEYLVEKRRKRERERNRHAYLIASRYKRG